MGHPCQLGGSPINYVACVDKLTALLIINPSQVGM